MASRSDFSLTPPIKLSDNGRSKANRCLGMNFWQLTGPNYSSDYRHSYINGSLEHPFGLPGIECDVCKSIWGGSRILPFELPNSLRSHPKLLDRWPLLLKDHLKLQSAVRSEFEQHGIRIPKLYPGDEFQPCFLDVPSRPRADFLWSSMGSVVVSERVQKFFHSLNVKDVAFCKVTLRKVRKREAQLAAPVPSSGEAEDIIGEVPLRRQIDSIGPYFELLVEAKSEYPPGGSPLSFCSGCGREDVDSDTRHLVMTQSMWRGQPIFHLATTLHIIVTDDFQRELQGQNFTNVLVKPYPAG